ncbi:MAG: 30S ribosome-binding factor RbfA [Bacilli bacterium]|nr:30S ribosome-binding factor RbfA [Bacilli bacterium]
MSVKIDRLNNAFVEKISEIIHNDIKDANINFVTITDVRITNDLSFAKVYFTTMDDDRKKVTLALNKASGFIRSELCNKVKIRKMPELTFVFDESIDYGKKIENIIERIKNEK